MARRMSLADFLNDPGPGWIRIIVAQSLALLGGLVTGVIAFLSGNLLWLAASMLSIIALLLGMYLIRRQAEPLVLVPENQQPAKHLGLIVLISKDDPLEKAARFSVEYHLPKLKFCWLVATAGTQGSLTDAQQFKEFCKSKQVTAEIQLVDDPSGVQNTYEVVRKIYEIEVPKQGLTEQDVIADVTGGTATMSIGMALACGERHPMEYMYGGPTVPGDIVTPKPRRIEFTPRNRRRA